jgi:RHS repeat-associated protein
MCEVTFGSHVFVVGDPVDVVTGANLDRQTEFVLDGPLPLPWYRWYHSGRNWTPGGFGWGHTHDYERRLLLDLDGVRFIGPNGTQVVFPPLTCDGDWAAAGGYRLRRIDSRTYFLSQAGQPTAIFNVTDGRSFAILTALTRQEARIEFRYNKDSYLDTIIDSTGRAIRIEYDPAGRVCLLAMPAPGGRTKPLASYRYDTAGNLIRVTDPYNHTFRYQFDSENRQLVRVDRRGYAFAFAYDDRGRCTLAGGEDGTDQVRLEYAPEHHATLVTRADGGQWLYLYDAAGIVTKIIEPDGAVRQFIKDEAGWVTEEVDPNGNAARRLYDAAGAVLGTVDPLGHRSDEVSGPKHRVAANPVEWDLGDLPTWSIIELPEEDWLAATGLDPAVRPFIRTRPRAALPGPTDERDEFGLLYRENFPDGTSRRWIYDPNGNITRYTDREGQPTSFEYASWNLRVEKRDTLGGRTRYRHAANRHLVAVTDPNGTLSEYGYDQKDRLIEVRRHAKVRETYQRDPAGNLIAKRDGDGNELLAFKIGSKNLPMVLRLGSGEVHTFIYDPQGRYLSAATSTFVVTFTYDDTGRRCEDQRDGFGISHRFGPDRLEETVVLDRFRIRFERVAGALAITDPTGARHRLLVFSRGLVKRVLANGSCEVTQYGEGGLCLARVTTRAGNSIWPRVYRYSPEGNLLAVEDTIRGTTRYRYDAAHRIAGMQRHHDVDEKIELDPAANVLRMPGLSGAALRDGNRLAAANGEQFEYDHRNHISIRSGQRSTTRYHYNSQDMLVRIERDGQPDWTADYDPLGRRVWKAWGTRKLEYFWDTDRLAAERDETGRLRVYVYADPFALVPIMFVDYSSMDDEPEQGQRYYIHADQIGTPLLVEDDDGRTVWSATIDPFGRALVAAESTIEFNLRFPGHFADPEVGLHYNRFRYYDPGLGRYLQSDPLGIAGGLNLYAYPSNPLTTVDVRGLADDPPETVDEAPPAAEDTGAADGGCPPGKKKSRQRNGKRRAYLGQNPKKGSDTYNDVVARMKKDGLITGDPPMVACKDKDGNDIKIPLDDAELCHRVDAVAWWNDKGKYTGAKSDEVRTFMTDPDNYDLGEPGANRSAGAKLGKRYDPPEPRPDTPPAPPPASPDTPPTAPPSSGAPPPDTPPAEGT